MLKANIPEKLYLNLDITFKDTSTGKTFEFGVDGGRYNRNFYLTCFKDQNDAIFHYYKVDRFKFVESIVGYEVNHLKLFPEVRSLEDLRKVCIALQYIDEY